MDYTKFYTPYKISEFLINQLEMEAPDKAIDICCGGCNLLHAVKKRWNNTKLIGVDIVNTNVDDVRTIVSDGRKFALETKTKYSLVVANPPFNKVTIKNQFPNLYKEYSKNLTTSRLEVEMLLANLLLLKSNGTLVIIMPISFVNSQRYYKYREMLSKYYYIKSIYKLPINIFGSGKIKTYAIILNNSKSNNRSTLVYDVFQNKSKTFDLKKITEIKLNDGNWLEEYSKTEEIYTKRGNISSNQFDNDGQQVLHTAKKSANWNPSHRYTKDPPPNPVFAETGDIIVSRIGQSAGCFCIYSGNKTMISDCLFIVKDPRGSIAKTIKGRKYNLPIRGVSTPYITTSDFIRWYISIDKHL